MVVWVKNNVAIAAKVSMLLIMRELYALEGNLANLKALGDRIKKRIGFRSHE